MCGHLQHVEINTTEGKVALAVDAYWIGCFVLGAVLLTRSNLMGKWALLASVSAATLARLAGADQGFIGLGFAAIALILALHGLLRRPKRPGRGSRYNRRRCPMTASRGLSVSPAKRLTPGGRGGTLPNSNEARVGGLKLSWNLIELESRGSAPGKEGQQWQSKLALTGLVASVVWRSAP